MYIVYPIINTYLLSSLTILIGYVMDFTISKNTLIKYCQNELDLYISGIQSSNINLLIISPLNYILVYNLHYIDYNKNIFDIQYVNLISLLLAHNFFYFIFHSLVHKIHFLRFIHNYHHQFRLNLPSISNSVSIMEFQFMYVLPFCFGAYFFHPNIITFNISIFIISLFNILIHCDELTTLNWLIIFVSPQQHAEHHLTYGNTYSAPIINFDLFFSKKMKQKKMYEIFTKYNTPATVS